MRNTARPVAPAPPHRRPGGLRCLLPWLAALVLSLSGGPLQAAAPIPAVEELPLLATLGGGATPVRLRGHLDRGAAAAAVALGRTIYDDVNRRFVARREPAPPVELCLFARSAEYEAFVRRLFGDRPHSVLGFYEPGSRVTVVNLERGIGNLRHELVHPLLGDDFPAIPAWLTEGIAALYGSSAPRGGAVRFLVNYRLRSLRAALRAGALPDLDALCRSGASDVRGERAATYYALARYVLLYVERRGQLDGLHAALRGAAGVDAQAALLRRQVDEAAFLRWVQALRE